MMKNLIAYVHFLGFMPALALATDNVPDGGFSNMVLSAVFSWGLVLVEVVK